MDQLYSINEVADRLNISDKTLRRWEEAGRFAPSRTLGNQRRYSTSDLQILDAIKHGLINSQQDLLTAPQAANLCGVTVQTIARWDNEGKIHPFITSSAILYSRSQILSKLDTIKSAEPAPANPPPTPTPTPTPSPTPQPQLPYANYVIPALSTLLILTLYHFLFVRPHLQAPLKPQGTVQGLTTSNFDPRVDDLIRQFKNSQARYELLLAKPTPSPDTVASPSASRSGL